MPDNITLTTELQAIIERTAQQAAAEAVSKYKKEVKPKRTNRAYLSIKEFAEHFGMKKQTVSKLIKERKIHAIMPLGTTMWRIPISEIENYEKKSRIQTQKDIFTY
ncbi:MAG: helix-turn-helix domain-containing protein [Endomicrobia bacterium]|nr:helix-turn-helix domain-containing protein [Endomicrobiia bacterium]